MGTGNKVSEVHGGESGLIILPHWGRGKRARGPLRETKPGAVTGGFLRIWQATTMGGSAAIEWGRRVHPLRSRLERLTRGKAVIEQRPGEEAVSLRKRREWGLVWCEW